MNKPPTQPSIREVREQLELIFSADDKPLRERLEEQAERDRQALRERLKKAPEPLQPGREAGDEADREEP